MDDQLFKLLTLIFIAIVALAQSSKMAIKSLARRAEKKNGNPGNSGKTTTNGKMCIKHDRAITVNTTNITNIEKKIDKSIEENGKSFTRIFDKLDDLKG